jgi:hypothetical protein
MNKCGVLACISAQPNAGPLLTKVRCHAEDECLILHEHSLLNGGLSTHVMQGSWFDPTWRKAARMSEVGVVGVHSLQGHYDLL